MFNTLIEYEDSTIIHTIPGLMELVYFKAPQTFQATKFAGGNVSLNDDIDTACYALYTTYNLSYHNGFYRHLF